MAQTEQAGYTSKITTRPKMLTKLSSTFSAAEFAERHEKSRLASIATDEVVLVAVGVRGKKEK